MRPNRASRVLTMAFLILTVASLTLKPRTMASETWLAGSQSSSLVFNKEENVEVSYSPLGGILSEMVKVRFEANNNGSSSNNFSFRDRVESIDVSTLTMLYGTPNPKTVEAFGNMTMITWDAVKINARNSVEYQYTAQTWRNIPIIFNESIYVNGNLTYLKHVGKIYVVSANKSDTITLQFTVKNVGQGLYTGRKVVTPQVSCTVTASLSNDYFTDLKSSPEANSTSALTGTSMVTWITLLNDSITLSLSAKVKEISTWGEAPIEPLSIQLKSESETMVTQIQQMIKSLNGQIDALNNFVTMFDKLPGFLKTDSTVDALKDQLSSLEDKKADLEDRLLIMQYQRSPYDVEVLTQHSYEAILQFEKYRGATSFSGPEWVLKSIEVTNTGNSSLVINGMAFEVRGNQSALRPKYALVLVGAFWQMFRGDPAQLGVDYDTAKGTVYLWPKVAVNASKNSNVLVDWTGKPIQLVFEYENEPIVSYVLDAEESHPNVKTESIKSGISCSIVQPHVFARNMTFTGFNPPPNPQGKDWLQVLTEYVWSPAVLVSGTAIVFGVLMLQRRRRKIIALNNQAAIKYDAEKSLLHEVDRLKKMLEEKKSSN